MIDLTGGQFVVTRIDGPTFRPVYADDSYGSMPGYMTDKMPAFTVQWCGGTVPKNAFVQPAKLGELSAAKAFLAVPIPKTDAEQLAAAVLMGEPCGQHLVEHLIDQSIYDLDGEFAAKVRAAERARCLDILSRAKSDAMIMEEDGGDPFVAEYVGDIMAAIRENAA